MNNLYEILGVEPTANSDEIKKAYRKLSLLHHPDRPNGSSEMFKNINEAFEILGDPKKRNLYDLESSNPFLNMSGNINPMDIFSKLFNPGNAEMGPNSDPFNQGNIDPMFPFSNGIGPKIHIFRAGNMPFHDFEQMQVDEPDIIEVNLPISMFESFNGCNKPIEIDKYVIKNGKKIYEKETIYVNLFKGIDNNECVIVKNKGNVVNNRTGDIKIKIQLNFSENYLRNGLNLIYKKQLTLNEALCGFSFLYEHLNNKSYKINHNGEYIIQPNHIKEIPNLGFERENNIGNLIIHFNIKFPDNLSVETRTKISELLIQDDNETISENS